MRKFVGATLMILLILQFSVITYAFLPVTAAAIITADGENRIAGQSGDSAYRSLKTVHRDSSATVGSAAELRPIALADDSFLAETDTNGSSSKYRHDYLLDTFWLRYREEIITAAIVLLLVILQGVIYYNFQRKQYALIKKNEEMLRSIAANINGGVLVLDPRNQYRILYANDGFLKLVGCSEQELKSIRESSYRNFVHPDDRAGVQRLLDAPEPTESFSCQIRIRSKSGKYLPLLVKGSLVKDEYDREQTFCVVMDISRERFMMEELQYEQERHKILMEKSDDIIFEASFIEHTVKFSPKFEEKFGWSLPAQYHSKDGIGAFRIYQDDVDDFITYIHKIKTGAPDGEFTFRTMKGNGEPCWCKVIYHVFIVNGVRERIIGKITDIDEEMKEKQFLLQKAQVDALTGLYNKEAFRNRCVACLQSCPETNSALVFFDVDNFKDINDSLGHALGDKALQDISQKVRLVFSDTDILGRFGGDEFCALVQNVEEQQLKLMLDRLLEELRLEFTDGFHRVFVSVSIGAVCTGAFGRDFDKLLEYADRAQYHAKEQGKNGYALFSEELLQKAR